MRALQDVRGASRAGVRGLLAAVVDGGDYGNLPVLADALEDAGCQDEAVLLHLRSHRNHFPGCWAVDLVADACRR